MPLTALADAFGWHGPITVSPGPRGALGQLWRVEVGGRRYAAKELFGPPPSTAFVAAEAAFIDRAVAAGVRAPRPHRDIAGRYVTPLNAGTWVRLYDWVDVTQMDLAAPQTPAMVGTLIARLHRAGPPRATEADGSPVDHWYHAAPAVQDFEPALSSGMPWVPRLSERLATVPELTALLAPPEPSLLRMCHRDLHPGNVLADPTGSLVVVDWDDLGPADPGRELARALFDWYSDPAPDLAAMQTMCRAYLAARGPGRIVSASDFTTLVASRLNFLLKQVRIAIDPGADSSHRAWAEQEIDEALRILPTPEHLSQVLALCSPL